MKNNIIKELNNDEFISTIIIPAFSGFLKYDINLSLHNHVGDLLFSTDKTAKWLGFENYIDAIKNQDLVWRKFLTFAPQKFHELHIQYLMDNKKILDIIWFNQNDNKLYLSTSEPLLHLNGKALGYKTVRREIKMISNKNIIETKFKINNHCKISSLGHIKNINLTRNEENVLFLLINGCTQQEMSCHLKCSRSFIAKIINEGLCPKFSINGSASKMLIEKAISAGYSNFIPKEMLTNYFILNF